MSTEKLSELRKPVAEIRKHYPLGIDAPASAFFQPLEGLSAVNFGDLLYSQEYVSALLARIEELEWRELNSTELKELLTWHPTERSAATDPILWAAMRNKINFTLARVAADEAMKEQSNG
ncbi:hypothetical protein ACUNI2_27545 [Serratia sp. IR-2025]